MSIDYYLIDTANNKAFGLGRHGFFFKDELEYLYDPDMCLVTCLEFTLTDCAKPDEPEILENDFAFALWFRDQLIAFTQGTSSANLKVVPDNGDDWFEFCRNGKGHPHNAGRMAGTKFYGDTNLVEYACTKYTPEQLTRLLELCKIPWDAKHFADRLVFP